MIDWVSCTEASFSLQSDIHVWRVLLNEGLSKINFYESFLSSDERSRANQFKFSEDHHRFVLSHGVLRCLLGSYLGKKPEDLYFSKNGYGKPSLVDSRSLEFNLSHSRDVALIACCTESSIGIDVEYSERHLEYQSLAERFFSQEEADQLSVLKGEDLKKAFFHVWTRKEAVVKAMGEGLSYPLKDFSVSVESKCPKVLSIKNEVTSQWKLLAFNPCEEYTAAVATAFPFTKVNYFNFLFD